MPVVRQTSFISQVHISELPYRLHRKVLAQSNAVEQTKAHSAVQERILAERLKELEEVSHEAKLRAESIQRMTAEVRERDRVIEELQSTAINCVQTIEQLDNERKVQEQAAEERLSLIEILQAALQTKPANKKAG